ncbi:glutathione S-transferase theta-1a [Myripristis murdjan]|uniref:glutathione transferase n=1 Tax=Myripristis murdjan TaxID=586833 RepID=A0A667YMC6_9TELE|nr:glutathione S-transferase theta-1-like [Myripristis murdjan]
MPLELYLDLHSQPCRSVFLFAKTVGIPFEFKLVDLTEGQHFSEDFGKLSIVRKVPVMKDGNFVLTESIAILQYMVQKFAASVPEHWYPADLQTRARVDEYLSWQHTGIRASGSKVFLLKVLFPAVMGSAVQKEKLDAALEDLDQSLGLLEEKFLQNKPFIAGDKISLADLVAIVEIMQPVGTGMDVFEGRPKLSAWRDRVKKEIGAELFDEAHKVVLNMDGMAEDLKKSGMLELFKPKLQKMLS